MTDEQQHGYRDAEIKPYCACGTVASETCLRCGSSLCEEHAHTEDKRCERCEDEWTTRQRGYAVAVAVTCVLGVPAFWFLMLPFFAFVWWCVNGAEKEPAKILVSAAVTSYTPMLVVLGLRMTSRKRFLRQRPKQKQ